MTKQPYPILLKRAYDKPAPDDGSRVLVTLVFAARDAEHDNAVAVRDALAHQSK